MTKERIWISENITNCDLCDAEFIEDQVMFDAKVVGGPWAYICPCCQKTRTMAGRMNQEESGSCFKYTYQPYRKEETS